MKIKRIFAMSLLTLVLVAVPMSVVAHEGEVDDTSQQQQVTQPTATQPIEVPKTTSAPIDQNSGFVDQNDNPVSVDDYNKQRAESTKGAFEKYPVPFAVLGLAILGGAGFLIFKKVKVKK